MMSRMLFKVSVSFLLRYSNLPRMAGRCVLSSLLLLMLLVCAEAQTAPLNDSPSHAPTLHAVSAPITDKKSADTDAGNFVRAQGARLVLRGKPFMLRGINFSNYYEMALQPRELLDSNHHGEENFRHVAGLGMNSVRFAFKGEWYERDPKAFFAWLDRNIAWARDAGIYLILDLHVPIGGFWLDPTSDMVDYSLWSDRKLQERNLTLWRAIAARYRNEPYVAAYDLLNEPVTTDADGRQWQLFATRLVEAVRQVDQNHLLIIGKLYGVDSTYTTDGAESQFLVADDNVMYDFHFYEPIDYTHQYASWIARPMGDGGRYPDPEVFLPTGRQVYLTSLTEKNPRQMALKPTWKKVVQPRYRVDDQRITMAVPTIVASEVGNATVLFDHLVVNEYDHEGRFVRVVLDEPLSGKSVWQWWGWHSPAEGRDATFTRVQDDGVNDSYSLAISNVRGAAGESGWTSDRLWFRVKQGHAYDISGYLRADGLTKAAEGAPPISAYIDLAFYGEPEDAAGFVARDRKYLQQEFMNLYRFGQQHNVPMSVMEFGLMRATFEMQGKGGTQWVSDMLDILHEHQVSFSYWNYHGDRMGLYLTESGEPPGEPNQELMRTLRSKLHK